MKTTDLYTSKKDCCGCELCSHSCPTHIIKMVEDNEGFLYPAILNEEDCINCKKCLNVCPMKSPGCTPKSRLEAVGGYANNIEDIKKSSSGGFSYIIGKKFISSGGIVYGVSYDHEFRSVKYMRANDLETLELFRTSKYTQAYKGDVYEFVKSDLSHGKMVLFVGLPCEISALYHAVKCNTDNLYTVSLICHGPTSPKVQSEIVSYYEQIENSRMTNFSLRHKEEGWKPYYVKASFLNGEVILTKFKESPFAIAFKLFKRPSCSYCRYKDRDNVFGLVADLTIGDFHAVESNMKQYNQWGVSQAVIQSEKGKYLISLIIEEANCHPINMDLIKKYNLAYHEPIRMKWNRSMYVNALNKRGLIKANQSWFVLLDCAFESTKSYAKSVIYRIYKALRQKK